MPSVQKTTDLVLDADQTWKPGLNQYMRERSKKVRIPLFWSSQVLKPGFKRRKGKDSFDYYMGMLRYCRQLSGNLRPSINTRAEFWLYVSKRTNLSTFKYFLRGTIYISKHNIIIILDKVNLRKNGIFYIQPVLAFIHKIPFNYYCHF